MINQQNGRIHSCNLWIRVIICMCIGLITLEEITVRSSPNWLHSFGKKHSGSDDNVDKNGYEEVYIFHTF